MLRNNTKETSLLSKRPSPTDLVYPNPTKKQLSPSKDIKTIEIIQKLAITNDTISHYSNGESYVGLKDKNNKRTGKGSYFSKDGSLMYKGFFKDDKRDSFGKLYDKNGVIRYEGLWKNNKGDGEGKIFSDSGQELYAGEF